MARRLGGESEGEGQALGTQIIEVCNEYHQVGRPKTNRFFSPCCSCSSGAGQHGTGQGSSSKGRRMTPRPVAVSANHRGAKAVAELKNPSKDSVNPYYNSKYADLATVRDAVLPVLARHDLAVLQLPCELDNAAALTTLRILRANGSSPLKCQSKPSRGLPACPRNTCACSSGAWPTSPDTIPSAGRPGGNRTAAAPPCTGQSG
jgi:hypothetical protein